MFHHPGNAKALGAQTAGFRFSLHRNKSQVVTNHKISRVNEPLTHNPQEGRSVERQIRYLNHQNVLGASTAPDCDADL